MTEFRKVTESFSVSPQISAADVASAAAEGFTLIVNNRPDGEDAGQPTAGEIEAAAHRAHLVFVSIPVVGQPTREQVMAVQAAIAGADGGMVLAYCRSGTRSITTWAIGEAARGGDRADIVARGAAAGYDLSWLA